jgi:hypothetical protein
VHSRCMASKDRISLSGIGGYQILMFAVGGGSLQSRMCMRVKKMFVWTIDEIFADTMK